MVYSGNGGASRFANNQPPPDWSSNLDHIFSITFNITTQQNTTTPTASSSAASKTPKSSSSHTGAIAGGIVGGICGLALLAGIAFFFVRKKRAKAHDILTPRHVAWESEKEVQAQSSRSPKSRASKDASSDLVGSHPSELGMDDVTHELDHSSRSDGSQIGIIGELAA